jgi:hypothetical protein
VGTETLLNGLSREQRLDMQEKLVYTYLLVEPSRIRDVIANEHLPREGRV